MTSVTHEDVVIPLGTLSLTATLAMPRSPVGLVVFGHGSERTRSAPGDARIVASLAQCGIATLQIDLLTADEQRQEQHDATLHLDMDVLAARLIGMIDWVVDTGLHRGLPIGLLGNGFAATATLITGARRLEVVSAVVCCGGRPDLAEPWLSVLRTPTLLIVGSRDTSVLRLNRDAARTMVAPHRVAVISGATHEFAEPGALDELAAAAGAWFVKQLRAAHSRTVVA